jgi:hypothetical protein
MTGKSAGKLLFLILVGFMGSLFLPCCGVKQPGVTDTRYSSPAADHARFTDPCAACHENRRLSPTIDLVTVKHGFGRECAECHQYVAASPNWKPKAYTHIPTPPACLGCHSLPGESAKFKPTAHSGGQLRGDCAACHRFGTQWKVN